MVKTKMTWCLIVQGPIVRSNGSQNATVKQLPKFTCFLAVHSNLWLALLIFCVARVALLVCYRALQLAFLFDRFISKPQRPSSLCSGTFSHFLQYLSFPRWRALLSWLKHRSHFQYNSWANFCYRIEYSSSLVLQVSTGICPRVFR